MDKNLTDETLLVVEEKEQGKQQVKAVTGDFNRNGTPKTVLPKDKNNPDFLRIDRLGNVLDNFFSNFMIQCKNPTRFTFFKAPVAEVEKMAATINDSIKNGHGTGDEKLDKYRIKALDFMTGTNRHKRQLEKTQIQQEKMEEHQVESPERKTAIAENEVDWDSLKKMGINKELLQQNKCLETMLNYGKSPLLPVYIELDGIKVETQARLAFRKDREGKLSLTVHGVRKKPELDKPFYGHHFSDGEKKTLLDNGNLGKILNLTKKDGTNLPVYVSVDKQTNEIVGMRADKLNLPDNIKGVDLSDKQKQELREGKAVFVEGMTAKSGKEFSAHLQVNADRRGLEFIFNKQQNQNQKNTQEVNIPNKLGGVELSQQQQNDLKDKKTIYVEGMKDKKGQPYNAYIKVNTEKGKLDFYRWNPDKARDVKPDNKHSTQVEVNSNGKTNEATKHQKEPMKPQQNNLFDKSMNEAGNTQRQDRKNTVKHKIK